MQLEPQVQRKGLGRFMMQLLELMAFQWVLRYIMFVMWRYDANVSHLSYGVI